VIIYGIDKLTLGELASPTMEQITSVRAAIAALGGVTEAAALLRVKGAQVAGMWQVRDKIPPEYFLTVTEALRARGKNVSPKIFGMSEPETATASPTATSDTGRAVE